MAGNVSSISLLYVLPEIEPTPTFQSLGLANFFSELFHCRTAFRFLPSYRLGIGLLLYYQLEVSLLSTFDGCENIGSAVFGQVAIENKRTQDIPTCHTRCIAKISPLLNQ